MTTLRAACTLVRPHRVDKLTHVIDMTGFGPTSIGCKIEQGLRDTMTKALCDTFFVDLLHTYIVIRYLRPAHCLTFSARSLQSVQKTVPQV
jgi:hypothetical protein